MLDRKQVEAEILQKAAQDPDFRTALVNNPRGTIEKELGVSLPKDVKINIVEEQANDYYLVLPLNPEGMVEGEISDSQLAAASGGGCYMDCDDDCDDDYVCGTTAG